MHKDVRNGTLGFLATTNFLVRLKAHSTGRKHTCYWKCSQYFRNCEVTHRRSESASTIMLVQHNFLLHSKYYGYTGDKCSYRHLSKELLFLSVYLDHNRKPDLDQWILRTWAQVNRIYVLMAQGTSCKEQRERATTPESFLWSYLS